MECRSIGNSCDIGKVSAAIMQLSPIILINEAAAVGIHSRSILYILQPRT